MYYIWTLILGGIMKNFIFFLSILWVNSAVFGQNPFSAENFMSNDAVYRQIDSLIFDGKTTVQIDTFNISFVPPQYCMKINQTTFISPASTSSIQISELKQVVYPMAVLNINEEVLAPQGVHLLSKENVVTFDNKEGVLVVVMMKVDTIDFYRMMLFTGDYMRTVWLTANYPVVLKDKMEAILRKSILSVKF